MTSPLRLLRFSETSVNLFFFSITENGRLVQHAVTCEWSGGRVVGTFFLSRLKPDGTQGATGYHFLSLSDLMFQVAHKYGLFPDALEWSLKNNTGRSFYGKKSNADKWCREQLKLAKALQCSFILNANLGPFPGK
jgi:hypothetical protein